MLLSHFWNFICLCETRVYARIIEWNYYVRQGNLPALKVAVDNGADAVYIGFKDDTNARHFAGLNFSEKIG